MKIILVRHGQAEDESRPDSARQLTDFGQQQAMQTAEYVMTHYHPDYFVVSPYDRAQQTLAVFQTRAPKVPAIVQENITPSDDARQALIDIANIDADTGEFSQHLENTTPRTTADFVEAIISLTTTVPEGSQLQYHPQFGLGWHDPQGWMVYFGQDTTNIDSKLTEYQNILSELNQLGVTPALISLEFVHAPFYRMEQ